MSEYSINLNKELEKSKISHTYLASRLNIPVESLNLKMQGRNTWTIAEVALISIILNNPDILYCFYS